MKIILLNLCFLFLFLFISNEKASSQSRLGFSYSEIKLEFSEEETHFFYADKTPCFVIMGSSSLVYYYFDQNFICNQTTIVLLTKEMASKLYNIYNNDYIIIDKNNWKVLFDNGEIAYVTLTFNKKIGYIFTWR